MILLGKQASGCWVSLR